jgi:hypothetical protein
MTDHWLARPETIRKLWIVFIAILALTVVAELFIKRKAYFGIDEIFGFYAWYGFIGCVFLVAFSKALGALLKRDDSYYDGDNGA